MEEKITRKIEENSDGHSPENSEELKKTEIEKNIREEIHIDKPEGEEKKDKTNDTEVTENKVTKNLKDKCLTAFLLFLILLVALYFRLTGLDWDQGQHLHPDERFLTMVQAAMKWPESFSQYMDENLSPMNPRNAGYTFFVYGTLPMTVVKAVGIVLNRTGYENIHLVGRVLSAVFDTMSIFFLFLMAIRLYGDRRIALLAAFFMACTVLSIQQSHFFVVDNFAAFFVTVTLYFLSCAQMEGKYKNFILTGIFFGMAMASKVSIFTLAILITITGIYRMFQENKSIWPLRVWKISVMLLLTAIISLFVFRIAMPDAFQSSNIFNMKPSQRWMDNVREVRHMMTGEMDFPPGKQWTNRKPLIFPWENMVIWGMGLPLGLTAWIGWCAAGWALFRRKEGKHLIPFCWTGILFIHQGTQWVMSMRYFLPVYPVLILLTAWLLIYLWDSSIKKENTGKKNSLLKPLAAGLMFTVMAGTFLWAVAFTRIYTKPHSRVTASRWILENIKPGSTLLYETWDDPIPLRIDGKDPYGTMYKGIEMLCYDEDTPQKMEDFIKKLDSVDYVILSSNRACDSIPRLPMRYPMTVKYYEELFSGGLGFEEIADITSYPQIFGLKFPDEGAEEAFSVYDHPRVRIFKKTPEYNQEKAKEILGNINWEEIIRMDPRKATKAPTALFLSEKDWETYRASGTWSQLFNRRSPANKVPLIFWIAVLEIFGLIAFPYLFVACKSLPDRGYSISKIAGLLIISWFIWFTAGLKIIPYSRTGIIIATLIIASGSIFLYIKQRIGLTDFWRKMNKILILEETLFLLFFSIFLLIKWANPDLWHPVLGGEKPMDFAYLNAVTRSPFFPPYDPWFAKGYINYYYFGFVLMGTLIKVTGIVPSVAYNLAIPTLFAMTATASFGVTLAMGKRKDCIIKAKDLLIAFMGSSFVCITGNLAEIKLIFDSLANMGKSFFSPMILSYWVRVMEGIINVLLKGVSLPVRNEWWYWNATRVISHPPTEAGPINEFPWFTFLYGDLHAHAMALPVTIAVLLVIIGLSVSERLHIFSLAFISLATGALWVTNTWDVPAYSILLMGALIFYNWQKEEGLLNIIKNSLFLWIGVIVCSYVLYLPYHMKYASGYTSVELWKGSKTPLNEYLIIHGFFLFIIFSLMVLDLYRGKNHNKILKFQRNIIKHIFEFGRYVKLFDTFVEPGKKFMAGFYISFLFWIFGIILLFFNPLTGICLLLIHLSIHLLFRDKPDPVYQITYFFTLPGLILTFIVEFLVLKGDISRMNTVFKFYLQAWVLFALAAANSTGIIFKKTGYWKNKWLKGIWLTVFSLMLISTALYPILSTRAKILDRFDRTVGPTLDGAAFMEKARYNTKGTDIELKWDKMAMEWLQENVEGNPVIAEINTCPDLYTWGNRYSVYTGFPSVIGWDWHQRQQRGPVAELVQKRIDSITQLYNSKSAQETWEIIKNYDIDYIVMGELERVYTLPGSTEKFKVLEGILWDRVYENEKVIIYRVKKDVTHIPCISIPSPGSSTIITGEDYSENDAVNPFHSGGEGIKPGNFNQPADMALDGEGNIYVVDFRNNRIQKFDSSGKFLLLWGSRGTDAGEFEDPSGIFVDKKTGDIWVADTWNHRIQKFDSGGTYITTLLEGFYGPRDVALDKDGNIYVCDTGNRLVKKFNPQGHLVNRIGEDNSLTSPWAIDIDSNGNIYIADNSEMKIKVFSPEGKILQEYDLKEFCKNPPVSFHMFLADEYLLLSDLTNNYILKISKDGKIKKKLIVTAPSGLLETSKGEIIFLDHTASLMIKTSF